MSLKNKEALPSRRKCANSVESLAVGPSLEKTKKRSANGSIEVKEPKQKKSSQKYIQTGKKQLWVSSSFDSFSHVKTTEIPRKNYGQKLLQKSSSTENQKPGVPINNDVLWCDKYTPSTEAELAVHKRKVVEVRDWLLSHLTLQVGSGILLLTGPPGSGKTGTLQVLSKEIGFEILEWVNPLQQDQQIEFMESEWKNYTDMVHRQSQLKNFRDFFLRAKKYPCLSMGSSSADHTKKIVLVEDMPNMFYRNAKELHGILRCYQRSCRNPVVFIVSDSNSNDINAYRLFPKDVVQDLGISTISFNPISVTSLSRVASKIVSAESRKGHTWFQIPSKEMMDSLISGCNGDIRGMINNLQFFCRKGSMLSFQKLKHLKQSQNGHEKPSKRFTKKMAEKETALSSVIGGKDSSLFLFRVLGKILYCKREEITNTIESSLPKHLKQHERRPLLENPENVFEKSHMSGDNLCLYLHQNYLDFFNNIDDVCSASEYLSDADYLTAEWMNRSTLSCYTPCVAIRGLMFCNRGKSAGQTKNVWRPLHKPQWFNICKERRENSFSAIDLFKGHCRNAAQLHSEVIPFLALSDAPLLTPGVLQICCR